jgi:hypothetical protein
MTRLLIVGGSDARISAACAPAKSTRSSRARKYEDWTFEDPAGLGLAD